jgi:hypothetical protein
MKFNLNVFFFIFILFSITSCFKEVDLSNEALLQQKLVDKVWYLESSVTGNITQSFKRQATSYFITYTLSGNTVDSDGLQGTYSIILNDGAYQLEVKAVTKNGNSVNYTNTLVSIDDKNMYQTNIASGQSEKTYLYFIAK